MGPQAYIWYQQLISKRRVMRCRKSEGRLPAIDGRREINKLRIVIGRYFIFFDRDNLVRRWSIEH